MTDREKLIAILANNATCVTLGIDGCDVCPHKHVADCYTAALVDHLIANGVVVREKGEWVMRGGKRYCPVCKKRACVTRDSEDFWYTVGTDFCPNCGADMRKGENDGV